MRRFPVLTSLISAALATSLLAAPAAAQNKEEGGEDEKECLMKYVCVGLGFLGQAGGNFLTKPDDQSIELDGNVVEPNNSVPEYPGFAGLTTGFGPFIDIRILEYGGIEFGAMRQSDKGSAELKITKTSTSGGETVTEEFKFDIEIRQGAWHLPLLFKGIIPGKIVQPSIFIGPEFVIADDADEQVEVTDGTQPTAADDPEYRYFSENYTALIFGLGLEFKLPIPVVDIRIPLSLRGSVNLGTSGERSDREEDVFDSNGNVTTVRYKTSWQYQAVANVGASIFF